jgi:transcriptional regulator GlxA family with amidase domain
MHTAEGAGRSWHRLVRLLVADCANPQGLLHHPLIAQQAQRSLLTGLLLCLPHRYRDELDSPGNAGPPRAIRRALEAIQDGPERPFTVADLAEIAGMSVRSLQEGFRRHVGMAPMAYLQTVRLGRAHDALRDEDPYRVTVAAVAHRFGFAHLGRFARAYRDRYGVCPSHTLRRGA